MVSSETSFAKELESKLNVNNSLLLANLFILAGILFLVVFIIQFLISNNNYKNQSLAIHFEKKKITHQHVIDKHLITQNEITLHNKDTLKHEMVPNSAGRSKKEHHGEISSVDSPSVHDKHHENPVIKKFLHSYLFAFVFFLGIVLAAMFFVLLQHLTRSGWSVVVRRLAEVLMKNILLMVFFFLPLLIVSAFNVVELYHWLDKQVVANDPILDAKKAYLNFPFFVIRTIIYVVIWLFLGHYYYRHSLQQDKEKGRFVSTLKLERYTAPHIFLYAFSVTFFAFDYLMSLDPHWFSTIWGIYYFAGAMVGFFSFLTLTCLILRQLGYLKNIINIEHYHDLGKFLFAFTVFWSYIAFSQYLLIWYANIPEDTVFFLKRINGNWLNVSFFLIFGHIFLPILFFLSRNMKRNIVAQWIMALWMIFIHIVDSYWIVLPNVDKTLNISWVDVNIFLGMGFLFIGFFIRNLTQVNLIPKNDPRLQESLAFHNI